MNKQKSPVPPPERRLSGAITWLARLHLGWLKHGILSLIFVSRRSAPVRTPEETAARAAPGPAGPFVPGRAHQRGDLLLFVPRRLESWIIDHLTGRYGYSHLAVDCGEVDLPTGKPVMIESTVGQRVDRVYVDTYGPRHFARIPLARLGLDVERFCACVTGKLGQPYDNLEALSWGRVDDPARQVCSDLAAVCLPEPVRADIARAGRLGLLHRRAVNVYSHPAEPVTRVFISPNGFAEYYGAPQGARLTRPDQLVPHPRPVTRAPRRAVGRVIWRYLLPAAALGLGLGFLLTRRRPV